ncbi:MAG: glutamate synthase large subunit [Gemmatimonas sp.]|nr:glutamate synthase large subunit [Gemmatimonas sp.]
MTLAQHRPAGLPAKQGLYDPQNERDACGFGFIVQVGGEKSHGLVEQGLEILINLTHRGAAGSDPESGDGAGILLQIPHRFLAEECLKEGLLLPESGDYAVGMVFLPANDEHREAYEREIERSVVSRPGAFLGWRTVPTNGQSIGSEARRTLPVVRQFFIARGDLSRDLFERKLYFFRRRLENTAVRLALPGVDHFYISSLSSRTIVYKGLLIPTQITDFYPDLADAKVESAIALVHSRFSTNTFPTWARAHPYRYLCHNGEINALRGNLNWMRVREGALSSNVFGEDISELFPVIPEGQSDSASLDNVLEFLVMGGRSLPHAVMMTIPEAWEGNPDLDPEIRGFYEYHASIMEPWDGPAAVSFTDGRYVGATLDRNGLRPARYLVTHDERVVLASEAGVVSLDPAEIRAKGRLAPGKMLVVDTEAGEILDDATIKARIASQKPYAEWTESHRFTLADLAAPESLIDAERELLVTRQEAFGYTSEELRMILAPMAIQAKEPVGSMGTDTPLAVLSDHPQLLFSYFAQLFAQVTNPPIDPIREALVMSLSNRLGPRANLFEETPEHAQQLHLDRPLLTAEEFAKLESISSGPFRTATLSTLFDVMNEPTGMRQAVEQLCADAADAVREGAGILILSDRGIDARHAPIPTLLANAAVHHHLIRERLRTRTSLVVDTAEAREVNHFALLIGYGAEAVHPYLVFETLEQMHQRGDLLGLEQDQVARNYIEAVGRGLLKIFSKMGISTLQSYCGAQIFEALGLDQGFVDRYFAGTASRIGGAGMAEIAEETIRRHNAAFDKHHPAEHLPPGGEYHYRNQGEHHQWSPLTIAKLQQAAQRNDARTYEEFTRIANEQHSRFHLRGLFDLAPGTPVPIEEVEPAQEIVKRFTTGAMSFGALSSEAHQTLAIAMNRIGGRSNSGEGGEDPGRFFTERNSAIKQIASGRFGVTTHYLVNASELQIKMAQGAKPGEGGQLPGHKVDETIARTRHSTPGVPLISPPPHHDIYSIEDLAQLIYDLKTVNPYAFVSVKLVAEVGVGTVAAGVAKAHADLIVISGNAGGTGASPISSIKHAGIPWEMGLAETQQTLVLNGLRGRVRVQTDGQFRTGRDVVVAALLGADEYGFSTAPLIVEGCIMMRKCHLNTCPVGVATQDPALREKFTGQPEHVINYFFFVAEEVRQLMAQLGFRRVQEMIGRSDRLRPIQLDHWKASRVDLDAIVHVPDLANDPVLAYAEGPTAGAEDSLDHELIRLAQPALERAERVRHELPIRNIHRTVGAMLSGEVARRYGSAGLADDTIRFRFTGSAGQSFGAFLTKGVSFQLEGEANDYMGKGLSGGRIVMFPPERAGFVPEETILIGNVALYGATSGEVFLRGLAGERFCVRNSGATAVVEGVGDHACEYMTGGTVVVLGRTGRNFAAGMSGGMAYVLDEEGDFAKGCNRSMVHLEEVETLDDRDLLWTLIERHVLLTSSARGRMVLDRFDALLPRFVKVIPIEYKRVMEERALARQRAQNESRLEVVANG